MKKIVITAAIIAATGALTETSAQTNNGNHKHNLPGPHRIHNHQNCGSAQVSFNPNTKELKVHIPASSQDGIVEITPSNAGKITSYVKAGTTFSCNIGNYGNGNCTIIVSSGNTVIYYKNINNR